MFKSYTEVKQHIAFILNGLAPDASTDRASYIEWTQNYKRAYGEISLAIRALKQARPVYLYKNRPAGDNTSKKRTLVGPNPKHSPDWEYVGIYRQQAREMIDWRVASKTVARARSVIERSQRAA